MSGIQAEVDLSSFKSLDLFFFFALILDFLNTALMEGCVIKGQHGRSLCISFQLLS